MTNILIDLNSFWTHENRESLVAEPSSNTPTSTTSDSSEASSDKEVDSNETTDAKASEGVSTT